MALIASMTLACAAVKNNAPVPADPYTGGMSAPRIDEGRKESLDDLYKHF
jgi:hypothetical protein